MARYPPQGTPGVYNNRYSGLDSEKSNVPILAKSYFFATDTGKVYRCYTDGSWTQINFVISGTEANRSNISPITNDIYLTVDTAKQYVSLSDSSFTLFNSRCCERYSNHQGTVDNIMKTSITGNGTATTDNANHRMDLNTGIVDVGHKAKYYSEIQANPSTSSFRVDYIVQNIVNGTNNNFITTVGIGDFSLITGIYFSQAIDGSWYTTTTDGAGGGSNTSITALSDGDKISIIGLQTNAYFLKNGALIATHTTGIPNTNLSFTALVNHSIMGPPAVTGRQISIDYIDFEVSL
jgi:hypothetical protein